MSRFDHIMTEYARPVIDEHIGKSITHTSASGTDTTVTAVVSPVIVDEADEESGKQFHYTRTISVAKTALSAVAMKDTFTIDDEVWSIEAIEDNSATSTRVRVIRQTVSERTHSAYRGQR